MTAGTIETSVIRQMVIARLIRLPLRGALPVWWMATWRPSSIGGHVVHRDSPHAVRGPISRIFR